MTARELADAIERFVMHVQHFLEFERQARPSGGLLPGESVPQGICRMIDDPREMERMIEADGQCMQARADALKLAPVVAAELEARGEDATTFLEVVHGVDRAAGTLRKTWLAAKVKLQRAAMRLRSAKAGAGPPRAVPQSPTLTQVGNWDLSVAGRARYKGGPEFPLRGRNRQVLGRLIRARGRPVHASELKAACGADDLEDSTLSGRLARLRAELRRHLGLAPDVNPIRHVGDDSYELTLL